MVRSVSSTRIFAREVEAGVQALVYEMSLDSEKEVAMVLPLPVKTPAWEKAVRFVNLEDCPDFFDGFPNLFPVPRSKGPLVAAAGYLISPELEVVNVGAFEASFVPTVADFNRLDKRFRLPDGSFDKLPQYRDYGFAVFKLKAGNQRVHPMAFVFESRLEGQLFFPTVHIHDGEVHEEEEFDHFLYAQGWKDAGIGGKEWQRSVKNAREAISEEKSKGLVWGGGRVYRQAIFGKRKNEDIFANAKKKMRIGPAGK